MLDYFELFRETGRYSWRLKKADDTLFALAARSYARKTEAMREVAQVRWLARTATVEPLRESSRRFGWQLKDTSGIPLVLAANRFSTSARATSDGQLLRTIAPPAVLRDPTTPHAIYPLGDLPSALALQWPRPPVISQTRTVTASGLLDQPNTRYQVRANIAQLNIRASDVEVQSESRWQVQRVFLERGVRRVKFTGGNYQKIIFVLPYNPSDFVVNNDWVIEDVLFDGLSVDSLNYYARDDNDDAYAFTVRGRRVAIVRCYARSRDYCVWAGQDSFTSEDLIIAGNRFEGICGQATVRLYPVRRAVVVENLLSSVARHNFRVHGPSNLVYAARNTLINGGVMLIDQAMLDQAREDPELTSRYPWRLDNHEQIWLVDNVWNQQLLEMLGLGRLETSGERLRRFTLTGNQIASLHESHRTQLTNLTARPPATWVVRDNHIEVRTDL